MPDLFEEFQNLINKLPKGSPGASIELLLMQMEPSHASLFRLCAIPHQFKADILQVLDPDMNAVQAEMRYKEFLGLSAIIVCQDGLVGLHGETRRYLFAQWLTPPKALEFKAANKRLVEFFDQLIANAEGSELETTRRRKMFHLIGSEPERGFAEFESLFRQSRRQFRLSECESLIKLVQEYESVLAQDLAGRLAYHQGKLAADLRQWTSAEQLFNGVLDNTELPAELHVKACNRLGIVYAEQRKWQKAVEFHKKALELEKTVEGCTLNPHHILHDLGVVYRESGNLRESEKLLKKSIESAQRDNDDEGMAVGYNSLGTLYRKLAEVRQAIEAYERSLEHLDRIKEEFRPAQVYNNLGAAYADVRQWERSELFFQKSLNIKREAGDTLGQALTYNNLARVYQNLKLIEKAINASQQAIGLFREMRAWYDAAVATRNLARLYRNMQNLYSSQEVFQEAVNLFEQCNESEKAEETRKELMALSRKVCLPWWIWLAIISFILLICFIIGLAIYVD